ncbi:hypothetical protein AMR47_16635 [Leptospira interrogans]|nr:hypothetical protein AMR47_16635 [Leptospira interrogans]
MKKAIVSQNESHSLRENKCNFLKTEIFNLRIFYLLNKIHNLKLIFLIPERFLSYHLIIKFESSD